MKRWLLDYLACPRTGSQLTLRAAAHEGDEIVSGVLTSAAGHEYPLSDGVPDLSLEPLCEAESSTVRAFGKQWDQFPCREGYIASAELFFSFLPTLSAADVRGRIVLEAGCGNGRWLRRAATLTDRPVVGLDYSSAVHNSWRNTREFPHVSVVRGSILRPPFRADVFDLVYSIGVIHHLADPAQGMAKLAQLLQPGGRLAAWVYAREGNELYLSLVRPLRVLCPFLPPWALMPIAYALAVPVWAHAHTTNRWVGVRRDGTGRLPLGAYFDLLRRLTYRDVVNVVYDQLTPRLARYYRREELDELCRAAGLTITARGAPRGNSHSVLGVLTHQAQSSHGRDTQRKMSA